MKKLFLLLLLACQCALMNGQRLVVLEGASLKGDVNGDGNVNSVDVTAIYNYILNGDETYLSTSDVNGDGSVNSVDVTKVYNIILGLDDGGDDHESVDLGLPSGTLWATMNVGAAYPEGTGCYYAWAETEIKSNYNWDTYKWCKGIYSMTKYCINDDYGYCGYIDYNTIIDPEDDAATVNWGPNWCIPTEDQMDELIYYCTGEWTIINAVNGKLFTSKINGKSIFLPACGYRNSSLTVDLGKGGMYWTSSLHNNYSNAAFGLVFYENSAFTGNCGRSNGYCIRAVRKQ